MRTFLLAVFFTVLLTLSSCSGANTGTVENFHAKANIYISDVVFDADITENSVSFESINLKNPVVYSDNLLTVDGLSFEITPGDTSLFNISELIKTVLQGHTEAGIFKNTKFSCEFNEDDLFPEKLIWGEVAVGFYFFE